MRGVLVFGGPAACSVGVTALAFFFRVAFCSTVGEAPGGDDGDDGEGGGSGDGSCDGEARRSGDDTCPVFGVSETVNRP